MTSWCIWFAEQQQVYGFPPERNFQIMAQNKALMSALNSTRIVTCHTAININFVSAKQMLL